MASGSPLLTTGGDFVEDQNVIFALREYCIVGWLRKGDHDMPAGHHRSGVARSRCIEGQNLAGLLKVVSCGTILC